MQGGLMRRTLIGLALVALAAVPSCAAARGAAAAQGPPRSGGTLRLAIEEEPECLDPHQSPTEAARLLGRPLLDSLVHQDDKGVLRPWLATRWTMSADRLTYTFTLRPDVRFSDGTPFDAAAVVANLDHVVAPATKSLLAASLISEYHSSKVLDARTVQVRLSKPDSNFLAALASTPLGMESPRTLRQDPATLCAKIVGTGPFVSHDGLQPQQGISYVRNPGYAWPPEVTDHAGPAYLDGVDIQFVPDGAARYGALTSGQVDAIMEVSPTEERELRASPGFVLRTKAFPGVNYSYWPNTTSGPFADPLVRKAFQIGIDWQQIVRNVYFGTRQVARGVLSPTTPGYERSVEKNYVLDPALARRLLDRAGWTGRDAAGYRTRNGERLQLRHLWSDPSIEDLAVQVQASAKQLGIETVEQNVDGGTFVKGLLAGDYDLLDTSFSSSGPNVLQVMFDAANIPTEQRGIANNLSRYSQPYVQADLVGALAARDQAEQHRIYGAVQERISADVAVFPIYSDMATFGARDRVGGIAFDGEADPDLYRVWLAS
jgi:peptide/nickel transport system substrate-binding protein